MELRFSLDGPPQPKQRARRGKGGHWYTPAPTRRYETAVRVAAFAARCVAQLRWDLDLRYDAEVIAYFGDARRRDADNVGKAVLDACNGVLWRDDSQVRQLTVRREIDRDRPRTEVTVRVVSRGPWSAACAARRSSAGARRSGTVRLVRWSPSARANAGTTSDG